MADTTTKGIIQNWRGARAMIESLEEDERKIVIEYAQLLQDLLCRIAETQAEASTQ